MKVISARPYKRKLIGSENLEEYLKSEECLKKWAHLSIFKRLEVIRKKWKLEVGYQGLRKFYAINKIKWRRAYYAMKGETKDQEKLNKWRQEFAVQLKAIK